VSGQLHVLAASRSTHSTRDRTGPRTWNPFQERVALPPGEGSEYPTVVLRVVRGHEKTNSVSAGITAPLCTHRPSSPVCGLSATGCNAADSSEVGYGPEWAVVLMVIVTIIYCSRTDTSPVSRWRLFTTARNFAAISDLHAVILLRKQTLWLLIRKRTIPTVWSPRPVE
jgi:hypothetical protein